MHEPAPGSVGLAWGEQWGWAGGSRRGPRGAGGVLQLCTAGSVRGTCAASSLDGHSPLWAGDGARGKNAFFPPMARLLTPGKGAGRVLGPGRGAEGSPEPNKAPSGATDTTGKLSCFHFAC